MEILLIVLIHGIVWGAFFYPAVSCTIRAVLENPNKHSDRTVNICKRLTIMPRIVLSFLTALIAELIVWLIMGMFLSVGIIN